MLFLWILVIISPSFSEAQRIDPAAWERLQQLKGHVFKIECPTNDPCGSAPILLVEGASQNLEFQVDNSSITEFYLKGACLSQDNQCQRTSDKITFVTKLKAFKNGHIDIDIEMQDFVSRGPVKRIRLFENPSFLHVLLKPRVENLIQTARLSASAAIDPWKVAARSVFRLRMPQQEGDKFVYGESAFRTGLVYGTGFFVSPDGYALTNWHVVSANPDCLPNYGCELTVGIQSSTGQLQESKKYFKIVAASRYLDVALLKLNEAVTTPHLNLEQEEIGPQVLTMGFPSDREKNDQGPLTFSTGNFRGFYKTGFAYLTDTKVAGGASGSPLINTSNLKLIGIISNGGGDGNFITLSRPIHMVSHYLGLSDYLDGSKELRTRKLVEQLKLALAAEEALVILKQLQAERTLIVNPELEELKIDHPVAKVRWQISLYLRQSARELGPR